MSSSFCYSLLGHALIGALFFISVPSFQKTQTSLDSVPIFIDLKNVEISDKTNLPAKAEQKRVSTPIYKKPSQKSPKQVESRPLQKTVAVKDAAKIVEKTDKKGNTPAPKSKPIPPKETSQKQIPVRAKPKQDDGLDTLLASVEKMSKTPVQKNVPKEDVSDLISGVLSGIEGGKTTENIGEKLTVSETDFIATTVRKYWNLDAGIDGVENMVVDLRVSLNRDGSVSDIEFLNKNRYNQDSSFRSVAESAKRAVLVCEKMEVESPFKKLAMKYPNNYSQWQKLQLSFNPLDAGVF